MKGKNMDFRNEMRRDPYARGANGRYSPTFAPADGAFQGNGQTCRRRPAGVVSGAAKEAINTLPLAMAYVPEQRFDGVKEPSCALEAGTIFDALDLPFTGCRPKGGAR